MKKIPFLTSLLAGLTVLLCSHTAQAYPPADRQGVIYEGLQDLGKIAKLQGLKANTELGKVSLANRVERTTAPWHAGDVESAFREFDQYRRGATHEEIDRIADSKTFAGLSVIAAAAMRVVSATIKSPDDMYFASGRVVGRDYLKSVGALIASATFLDSYEPAARGITISDADALFLPSDVFITNNLAKTANTASDQKSSSSVIPMNTPVFIFGQIFDQQGLAPGEDLWFGHEGQQTLNPASDSWLVVWRPEFGLKFVRSRHVALVDTTTVGQYESMAKENLQLTCSGRVTAQFCRFRKDTLQRLTPVLKSSEGQHFIAASEKNAISSTLPDSINLQLYLANLIPVEVDVLDDGQALRDHLTLYSPDKNIPVTHREYLSYVHNCMFTNPTYSAPNKNRQFAWGSGVVGIDNLRGQDVSTLGYCVLQSMGVNAPRHSWDQVEKGLKLHTVYNGSGDMQTLNNTMVKHCTVGNMASFGRGSLMICLGNLTVEQLKELSPDAYANALAGGLQESDRVPLVASSPVGFRNGAQWDIVPESAVFPIFMHDASRSWINRGTMYIYSYLNKSEHQEL